MTLLFAGPSPKDAVAGISLGLLVAASLLTIAQAVWGIWKQRAHVGYILIRTAALLFALTLVLLPVYVGFTYDEVLAVKTALGIGGGGMLCFGGFWSLRRLQRASYSPLSDSLGVVSLGAGGLLLYESLQESPLVSLCIPIVVAWCLLFGFIWNRQETGLLLLDEDPITEAAIEALTQTASQGGQTPATRFIAAAHARQRAATAANEKEKEKQTELARAALLEIGSLANGVSVIQGLLESKDEEVWALATGLIEIMAPQFLAAPSAEPDVENISAERIIVEENDFFVQEKRSKGEPSEVIVETIDASWVALTEEELPVQAKTTGMIVRDQNTAISLPGKSANSFSKSLASMTPNQKALVAASAIVLANVVFRTWKKR